MPGVDGFEAARLIRGTRTLTRIPRSSFSTSAYEDAPSVTRGYEAGGVDYIVKPLMPEILKSKISVFVDLYRNNALLLQQIKGARSPPRSTSGPRSRVCAPSHLAFSRCARRSGRASPGRSTTSWLRR